MRKLALAAALGAAATLAAPLVQPAAAGPIQPAGIGAAAGATQLAEPVHCRPGWGHHSSFRHPDGCERRSYPRYGYYAPPPYPYPYAYGYAPGITLYFGGDRHHHRHRQYRQYR